MGIKVTVDEGQARRNMRAMLLRTQNFKSVFRWAQRELERANMANFATGGAASGKPWLPLDNEYARWKLAHHGPLPILIVTGTLRDSLIRLRGKPTEISAKEAYFGTDVKYAKYHQTGTRHMPARPPVFVPPGFAFALAQRISWHIIYGKTGGVSIPTPLLRRGL